MVTALIIVPLAESPRNGEAGDERAGRGLISLKTPWLNVNQTRLWLLKAVPSPVLALEVQRAGRPGPFGAERLGVFFNLAVRGLFGMIFRIGQSDSGWPGRSFAVAIRLIRGSTVLRAHRL